LAHRHIYANIIDLMLILSARGFALYWKG